MSRNPILVRNISHLTDARYFAAMEVDWISMELSDDPLTFSRWYTFRDWIAGVRLLAEPVSGDESLLAKIIIEAKPDGLLIKQPDHPHLVEDVKLFYEADHFAGFPAYANAIQILKFNPEYVVHEFLDPSNSEFIYLEADWSIESLQSLMNQGYKGGICLSGGVETTVGVRDFDLMDQLIELIKP